MIEQTGAIPTEQPAEAIAAEKPSKPLPEAALRALAEAQERRAELEARQKALEAEAEVAGRGGKDPVRYGDWEIKGLTSDF
jgi:hypothetical protein